MQADSLYVVKQEQVQGQTREVNSGLLPLLVMYVHGTCAVL